MSDKHVDEGFAQAKSEMADAHAEINSELSHLRSRMEAVEAGIADNTKLTAENVQSTAEILSIFKSVKGGFVVMGWLGTFAKWVAGVVAIFAALYTFIENFKGLK